MTATTSPRSFLVTGATGFIGTPLTVALSETYGTASVTALVHSERHPREMQNLLRLKEMGIAILECDLLELPRLKLQPPPFDVVYHLAAFAEPENPHGSFQVNEQGTRNLVAWLGKSLRGKRLVYTGSLASVDCPWAVEPLDEATPCVPKTLYGRTKFLAEQYLRSRQAELGFNYTILRLCTIVGRGFRPAGMFGVLPALLAQNALATRLNWPGRISFLGQADVVRILLAAPTLPQMANETYVLSNGENPTLDQLLDHLADVLNLPRHKIILPPWFWRALARVAWPLAASPLTPYRVKNFCWRVAHMIHDGLCANSVKLDFLLGNRYQSVVDALRETYGK